MKVRSMRLIKGFLAFIITISILFIGQLLWQDYAVSLPLDKSLQSINGIEHATLQDSHKLSEAINIDITLKNVENLQKTYEEIDNKISQKLDKKAYQLVIHDNRTHELEELYYSIHYYIQEAIANGDFPLLAERTENAAKKLGVVSRLYVDDQNIYVQFNKDDHSFYTIITRHPKNLGGNK